jgi:NAD(P)-dependent dehydrogenase (short-subunit alcohol dehydrogenase family)
MYQQRFRVENETAVVTGGGRSIGLCCAEALAEAGARVIVIERDEAAGAAGRESLAAKGYETEVILGDVADPARMTGIADELAARGTPATILVNNAGIGESGTASEDTTDVQWLRMMDVNVNGLFWSTRAFGRHMLTAGRGSIVNLGSISGLISNRPQPQLAYNVSKAAVHHITRCLAAEWAPRGVRVNAVAPTYIETPMVTVNPLNRDRIPAWLHDTPMGRMGQADEIAAAVLFLASDAASLMTGAVVPLDGGYTCW